MLDEATLKLTADELLAVLWWSGDKAGILGSALTGTPKDYYLDSIYLDGNTGEVKVTIQRVP